MRRLGAASAAFALLLAGVLLLHRDGPADIRTPAAVPPGPVRTASSANPDKPDANPDKLNASPDKSFANREKPSASRPAGSRALVAATEIPAEKGGRPSPADVRDGIAAGASDPDLAPQTSETRESEKSEPSPSGPGRRDTDPHPADASGRPDDRMADAAIPLQDGRRRAVRRLSLGAYLSGGFAPYAARGHADGVAAVTTGDGAGWEDSPLLGILLYNHEMETQTRVRHHQPVHAGVSISYRINGRLGIESGLCYTLLASDWRDGSDSHFYDGRQRLHYLGVPLNLTYEFARWRMFGAYGSAGVLAEQCVAGRIRKEYVLDGSSRRVAFEDVGAKPFQLSANLSAGVRYDLTPAVGIYAEPGVSYHFDDGGPLESLYKQRPLSFRLHVGVRFTLGGESARPAPISGK